MGAEQSAPHVLICDVSRSMEVGQIIPINARVNLQPARFAVNLKCDNGDIAFHFNPRFNENPQVVVCSTCTGGRWGLEERKHQMPFRPGESFSMTITIQNTSYEVCVNGKNYLTYNHRLPFHTVKELEILGDVKLEENRNPLRPDPPPYHTPSQNDSSTIENYDPEKETRKLPKRDDSVKIQAEFQNDREDEPDANGHVSEESKVSVRPDRWVSRDHPSNKHALGLVPIGMGSVPAVPPHQAPQACFMVHLQHPELAVQVYCRSWANRISSSDATVVVGYSAKANG